jgi:uncharacterized protein
MDSMIDVKTAAQNFIGQVAAGDFAAAGRIFDSNMAQALPEAKLKETWQQLIGQVGAFQNQLDCQVAERQDIRIVTVTCQFERTPLDLRLVFTQSGQLGGMNYQPTPSTSPYNPPVYVHADGFDEVEVTVGSGEWALPGTLSRPHGAGPFPAVVLVHGSGPQDRDETIGLNRPFRDLAWGLASQGIAVLRYEKRTKVHAGKFTPELIARVTVQDEVIDDALLAVQRLRQTPEIDPGRIYVLGHSLGGTLAPRIGQQDSAIAGLIVLGGMTRPMEDAILDQYTYLFSLSGAMTDAQKTELEELKVKVARVKDPNLSDQVPGKDLPLGVQAAYWLSMRGFHPAEVAGALEMRILVLQGGRDYQVTSAGDFPAWQKSLGEKSSATLKIYPKLFHLFITGEGPSTPQEYLVEGHVSEEVIQDIARWIGKP